LHFIQKDSWFAILDIFHHQAPRTMKASMLRVSGRLSGQAQNQSNHWQKIIESLDKLLKTLQDNYVCFSLFPYDSLVLDGCLLVFYLSSGTPSFSSENLYPDILVH